MVRDIQQITGFKIQFPRLTENSFPDRLLYNATSTILGILRKYLFFPLNLLAGVIQTISKTGN